MSLKQKKQIFQINVTKLKPQLAGDRPVRYLQSVTWEYRETNPASGRVDALNPGPPDYNISALNHPATLPKFLGAFDLKNCNHNGEFDQDCLKTSQTLGCCPPPPRRGGEP